MTKLRLTLALATTAAALLGPSVASATGRCELRFYGDEVATVGPVTIREDPSIVC